MTIEEKAKAYDEALERAKYYQKQNGSAVISAIFPEIKENEEGKIRTWLEEHIEAMPDNSVEFKDIKRIDVLHWLEKQDKKRVDVIESFDTEFEKQVSHLLASVLSKDYEYTEGFVKWVSNNLLGYAKHELGKQDEKKQEWGEDERIRKELIDAVQGLWDDDALPMPLSVKRKNEWLAWLEKQGERIPTAKVKEAWKEMRLEVYAQASGNRHQVNCSDNSTKMFSLNDIDEIIERINERTTQETALEAINEPANNANKVGPKFHKGEWITNGYLCCQISDVLDDRYIVNTKFEKRSAIPFKPENGYHLWCIKDANDGDVLVDDNGKPFIFKGLLDPNHPNCPVAYCGMNYQDKFTSGSGRYWCTNNNVKPSSKEQRDLLFKKMEEAGYKWDSENKTVITIK